MIGGGLVGTSLAYELASMGVDTVLIDRHDPGRATDAGAGILSPETSLEPDDDLFAWATAGAAHYPGLLDRLSEDAPGPSGFAVTGSLLVAERPGDDAVMDDAVTRIRRRSPDLVEEVTPHEAYRHFPPLGPVRRALWNPGGRRVDGRVLNAALRQGAVGRGVQLVDAGVNGLESNRKRDSVTGVATTVGTVHAGVVVICGGAWSAPLGESLGVDLPVGPLKGQIVHLSLAGTDSQNWSIVQPILGFYLVPWPDARVACGGTMEADAGFDHRPTAGGTHQLLRECLRTAPGLAQATLVEVRVGSRPSTPDGRPIIGQVPGWSNAWVVTGHGTEGLLLGPLSAWMVVRQLFGLEIDPAPLAPRTVDRILGLCSPDRFVTGGGS